MANPFTLPSISGYNSDPPPDDGSQVAANQLNWSKHKTKLGDPLKVLAEQLGVNTQAAFNTIVSGGGELTAGSTLASAATTDVLGAATFFVTVSGTGTITSLGTGANRIRFVTASGAFTLTHNATSLILPGGANITAASGDTFIVISDASSNARVLGYQRGAHLPSGYRLLRVEEFTSNGTWTKQTGDRAVRLKGVGGGGAGGGAGTGSGSGSGAGGNSGAYGETDDLVDVTGIASATVTIGAAGAAGAVGANDGGAGGDTIWSDGTNTFTWGGGSGGIGVTGSSTHSGPIYGLGAAGTVSGTGLRGGGWRGQGGLRSGVNGGAGGASTPLGTGGAPVALTAGNTGNNASGFGAGGGGGATSGVADRSGGAGAPGKLIVEVYG